MMSILGTAWKNCKAWFSAKAFIAIVLCLSALAGSFVWSGMDLATAAVQTGVLALVVLLGIASNGKSDRIVASFIMALLGFCLIYSVIEDFYKTLKISAGLFFISTAFDSFMQEVGSPNMKLLRAINAWLRKEPSGKNNDPGK